MLFTFPSRYLFTIGHARVLRLGGWSPHVQTGFHVSRPTRIRFSFLPVRGYHPLRPNFPEGSSSKEIRHWPGPRSLATTNGVSVDVLSSGYLDVSVPRVRLLHLCIQCKIPIKGGFPHSEISGSKSVCRLPEAYRRLQRPSSPLTAKASTVCA